jgi:hypothetical protein
VNSGIVFLLNLAEGPVFRCTFALLVLGLLRKAVLAASDTAAAYVTISDRSEFRRKFRQRVLWLAFPSLVLRDAGLGGRPALFAYHCALSFVSLIFRLGAVLVPAFMVAHVSLWERGLGISWPALPARLADVLAVVTIVAGLILFLGRIYSPIVRRIESPWSFLRPLALVLPFLTGFLAMHPTWSPLDYNVVLLIHILSACLVFALIPFTRLFSGLQAPLTRVIPQAEWRGTEIAAKEPAAVASPHTVPS